MPGYNSRGTYDVIVFILMRFRPFTLIGYVSVRFRFDPPSRAFSNRCVFDENAQRISVDGKPKRIEVYAFQNENALFWTRSYSFLCINAVFFSACACGQ